MSRTVWSLIDGRALQWMCVIGDPLFIVPRCATN
jgi:hypothetical protein